MDRTSPPPAIPGTVEAEDAEGVVDVVRKAHRRNHSRTGSNSATRRVDAARDSQGSGSIAPQ